MQKYFFSIIIPVFNSEFFLEEAILSIIKQDIDPLEIILINDCSNDKSLKLCKIFKKKYKNIVIINNKKNIGPGKCRNLGIKKAKGDYLIFLDSDDHFMKNSLKMIKNKIIKSKFPQVILNNVSRINDKKNINLNYFKNQVYSQDVFIQKLINHKIIFNECWILIIKNDSLLSKIRFLDIRVAEDNGYVMDIFFKMKNILINKSHLLTHVSRYESSKHLIGYKSAFSYFKLLIKYFDLIQKSKNNRTFIKYIKHRIEGTVDYLNAHIYLLNNKDKKKFFLIKQLKYLDYYDLFENKKNNKSETILKNIKNFKKHFESRLDKFLLIKKKTSGYDINIICAGLQGKSVINYFNNRKIKIDKIIDEDKNFHNKSIMNYNVHLFKHLKYDDFNNSINLICHQSKYIQDKFINKFIRLKVNLKNIYCVDVFK
ncbi:glycosyltransferase family 2 protein [Candidatus Pelagibacter sp. Uisw_106]|uniref:glycosyltransferase family 2 protein n=1 Tax=Candidatus Pelagibacter sp. Uisw_106 TaxID=3230984 RepID=UPI0039E8ADAC